VLGRLKAPSFAEKQFHNSERCVCVRVDFAVERHFFELWSRPFHRIVTSFSDFARSHLTYRGSALFIRKSLSTVELGPPTISPRRKPRPLRRPSTRSTVAHVNLDHFFAAPGESANA